MCFCLSYSLKVPHTPNYSLLSFGHLNFQSIFFFSKGSKISTEILLMSCVYNGIFLFCLMAIFWPLSLFMDRWKWSCSAPLMCVSQPPSELGRIAVVARPLKVATGTERSEATWKAALFAINKEEKTFCGLLLFEYFCVKLPIFLPESCLEIPAPGRSEGESVTSPDS